MPAIDIRQCRATRGDAAKPITVFHDHSVLGDQDYFEPECGALLLAVTATWYLRFSLSYRDLEELMAERNLTVEPMDVSGSGVGFGGPTIDCHLSPSWDLAAAKTFFRKC